MYRKEIEDLDKILEKLVNFLRKKLDWQNTIIIITADHGEAFGETGYFTHIQDRLSNPYHIKIPLVIKSLGYSKIDLDRDREVWTWQVYEFLKSKKFDLREDRNFCLGYKQVKDKHMPNFKEDYFPVAYFKPSKNILYESRENLFKTKSPKEIIFDLRNMVSERKKISTTIEEILKNIT